MIRKRLKERSWEAVAVALNGMVRACRECVAVPEEKNSSMTRKEKPAGLGESSKDFWEIKASKALH